MTLSLLLALAFTFLAGPVVELLLGSEIDLTTQSSRWPGWAGCWSFTFRTGCTV